MAGKKSDTTDVAALKRELEAANARAASAEGRLNQESARRREAEMASMSAQERSVVTAQEACDSRLQSLESEIASAKADIARLADEPGHGAEIADLQEKLADSIAAKREENAKKTYLAGQRDKFKTARERQSEVVEVPAGDVALPNGRLLSSFNPATQDWLRAHPKALKDENYFARTITFANAALARGLKNETPEFFAYVEDQLGETPAAAAAEDEETDELEEGDEEDLGETQEELDARHAAGEAARPQRPAAGTGSMAAPVARQAARGTGGGGNRRAPSLTPEQREVALSLYADLKINGKPASDADKLRHYAKNADWSREYRPAHFRGGPN